MKDILQEQTTISYIKIKSYNSAFKYNNFIALCRIRLNTETKRAILVLISISMLTAITMTSVTSLVIPVFAKNKHCYKSDRTCHFKTTQDDASYNDSNIIDEDSNSDGYQTEPDNSTSSMTSQDRDQYPLVGV